MMKHASVALALLVASVLCTACSTGSGFVPANGPFSGTLETGSGPLGQFTFTYTEGLVGGTATLTVDGNLIPVSITGLVSGKQITGEMRNVTLGGGQFSGAFLDRTHSSGTFTFVDTAETVSLSGTWIGVTSE